MWQMDVVKALYEQYPGLKEYKEERFRVACPGSTMFDAYMPDTEVRLYAGRLLYAGKSDRG